ncbi:hypothetical protein RRF57_009805 [Xylaria bambusicola]|uniref:Uncharacterized protein n=1 Tax=Xylaria bambusicola TaxID=326684 RepID=A0AAN7UXD2_9PEZI
MKYALPLLALAASAYAAPQGTNEAAGPETFPTPEVFPVPWPHPEIPEESGSIGIPTIPAVPTYQEPVPACTIEPQPHGGEQPIQGGIPFDEPHPAQPHHGPGFPPHQVAGSDATRRGHSLAALAISIAAAVAYSL